MQSTEIWKPVCGYEGFYEVSSHGRVRRVTPTSYGPAGRLLKLRLDHDGYPVVFLSVQSKQKYFRVHRLVAEAFLGKPDGDLEVCHADDVKTNNHVHNLRWDTHRNNMRDMVKNGAPHLQPSEKCRRGLHEMTAENTLKYGGGKRVCKPCNYKAKAERRARVREQRIASGEFGVKNILRGEEHPSAKITIADVDAMKQMRREGSFFKDIGAAFGISRSHAQRIVHGQRWAREAGA